MKRALKAFGNVLGNCLGNKNYLRWANKFPTVTPPPPQKSDTVAEVPQDIHQSRYNAMEVKQREALKTITPVVQNRACEGVKENEEKTLAQKKSLRAPAEQRPIVQEEHSSKPQISSVHQNVTNSDDKDDSNIETDPAKLERKRRQQQKKEEFLQQLKRRKSEDFDDGLRNPPVPLVNIKREETSPIAEGWYWKFFIFNFFEFASVQYEKDI